MNSEKWEQAKQLYETALKIGRDDRPRFLVENCSGDEELLREVESLLACSEEAAGFLDKPAIGEMAEAIVTQSSLTGQKILHYEILKLLGAGGMGEVYLAEDTRLKRRIALKVLPPSLSEDKKSVQRFEQEACAASALNHPNILTIHEFATHNGMNFIASELVEGETLRERLVSGKTLTLPEALDMALQVGAALRAAHGSNIIHRDIKPENVMIRDDGLIKVLDFGLAKLTEDKSDPVDSKGETWWMTTPGMIMGTAVYMSPEQARGHATDARTDIWSLGIVLYEMLAGNPPFKGDTASDTMASILVREPETLENLPPELTSVLGKALQKDTDKRYQTVNDLISDLENFRNTYDFTSALFEAGGKRALGVNTLANRPAPDTIVVTRKHLRSANRKLMIGWVLLSIATVAAFIGTFYPGKTKQAPPYILDSSRLRSFITWDAKASESDVAARFSPTGKRVAYVLTENGRSNIFTRQVPEGKQNKLIPDDKWNNKNPIWSPDGEQIAFISNRNDQSGIWSMPFSGGDLTFISVTENVNTSLLKWSRKDGEKIYLQEADAKAGLNVFVLDLSSREVRKLTKFDPVSEAQYFSISPDENRIAYSAIQDGRRHIFVTPLEGGTPLRITNDSEADDTYPFWLPDGKRIIYNSKRNGVLQPYIAYLDEEGRTERINVIGISNTFISDVAADGSRILFQHFREEGDLWKIGTDGKNEEAQITSDSSVELAPNVSPDGKSVVFQSTSEAYHLLESTIKSLSLEDKQQTPIAARGFAPAFSPDGRKIAFLRPDTGGRNDLWITGRNGDGERHLTIGGLSFPGFAQVPFSFVRNFMWSPDGTSLVFSEKKDGLWNLWQAAAEESGAARQISDNRDENILFSSPAFAPDGKRIAWTSFPSKPPPDGNSAASLYLWNEERIELLYKFDSIVSLIGWAGNNLVIAEKSPSKPGSVLLKLISAGGKRMKDVAPIDAVYFNNIQLSPDGSRIALSTREDGNDYIRIISIPSGKNVRITPDPDPAIYISGIAWSPDGKALYFSKQKKVGTISLADNVKQ